MITNEEILAKIASDLNTVESELSRAKFLTTALKEAGENVTELETKIKDLDRRKVKWQKMLEGRGIRTI